ncbi:MAG: hypothetical protein L6R40_003192 [Gallowayella cf. fulva]|nr:MAG: hypothetical protein L6R40_003192 [Xanthomendoza cf. fulva]
MPWPHCPYRIDIPKRKGNQYLLVTKSDDMDHGDRARTLALEVCCQMIEWLRGLRPGDLIDRPHWEHKSYGQGPHAEELSIWMGLVPPPDVRTDLHTHYLDRELAYFALQELKIMLEIFGALQGQLELHAFGLKRAEIVMHVFNWPPDVKEE